jgi:integrase/recombinase XerD
MARSIKTKIPGQIIVRETNAGNEYLYYIPYKGKKRVSTGLIYSKPNVKVVELILEHQYRLYLESSNKAAYEQEETRVSDVQMSFHYFKQHLINKGLSKSTIYEYEASFNRIIQGDYPLNQKARIYDNGKYSNLYKIEADTVTFINESKLSNNTINKHIRHLQTFISFLNLRGDVENINVYKKHKLDITQKEVVPYTPEEATQIIRKAKEKDEILYLTIMLYYLTGARLSEWLRAYFNKGLYSVDMESKIITFRNKINKNQSQIIPMSDKLYEVLSRLKELADNRVAYSDKVIPYSENSRASMNRQINKIERELGIKQKGRSTHGFRRLLATELFEKGIPMDVIKDIMRHSSIETTIKSYRQVNKQRITDSMDKLDR